VTIPVGANFKIELEQESGSKPVYTIHLQPSTGSRRFALWPYDVTSSGNTFLGLGPVRAIDPMEWAAETPLTEMSLAFFVQNDPDFLADLQQNSRGRTCNIRLVFVNASNAAIDDESLFIAHRRMVPGRLTGGRGEYVCQIGLESRLHRHRLRAPRTYSDAEQKKSRSASDDCFRDVGKELAIVRDDYRKKSGL
jgi:hypothetical protein